RARLRVIGFRRVGRRGAVPAAGAARRAPPLRAAVLLDLLLLARDGLVRAAGGGSAALHLAGALVADAGGDGRSTAARDGTRRVVAGRTVAARRAALPGPRRLLAGVRGPRGVGRGTVARQRAVGRRGVRRVAGQGAAVLIRGQRRGALVLGRLTLRGGAAAGIAGACTCTRLRAGAERRQGER